MPVASEKGPDPPGEEDGGAARGDYEISSHCSLNFPDGGLALVALALGALGTEPIASK
jgi:hypothetical protein